MRRDAAKLAIPVTLKPYAVRQDFGEPLEGNAEAYDGEEANAGGDVGAGNASDDLGEDVHQEFVEQEAASGSKPQAEAAAPQPAAAAASGAQATGAQATAVSRSGGAVGGAGVAEGAAPAAGGGGNDAQNGAAKPQVLPSPSCSGLHCEHADSTSP